MKKTILAVAVLTLITAPACRHRAKPVAAPPVAAAPAPAPPPLTAAEVPSRDFIPAQPSGGEVLSSDVTELNRMARESGWIDDAFFEFDSFVLTSSAQRALATNAQWLRDHPDYALNIEGHCDERGTEQYNLALGERRANSARTYLVGLGVDGDRLTTVSYGEERPFDDGHDERAWARNRRAHVVLGSRFQRPPR
jgi:peptidoglycan-associated lipoprotein